MHGQNKCPDSGPPRLAYLLNPTAYNPRFPPAPPVLWIPVAGAPARIATAYVTAPQGAGHAWLWFSPEAFARFPLENIFGGEFSESEENARIAKDGVCP